MIVFDGRNNFMLLAHACRSNLFEYNFSATVFVCSEIGGAVCSSWQNLSIYAVFSAAVITVVVNNSRGLNPELVDGPAFDGSGGSSSSVNTDGKL
jgi:hypothetical protein